MRGDERDRVAGTGRPQLLNGLCRTVHSYSLSRSPTLAHSSPLTAARNSSRDWTSGEREHGERWEDAERVAAEETATFWEKLLAL